MDTLRAMRESDLDQILVLEKQHQLHPWPRAAFEQAMRLGQYCVVYEEKGHSNEYVVGYGVANRGHGRTICATSVEAADAIYNAWFQYAKEMGADMLRAEIEADNRAARVRLKRFGFIEIGVVPAFYGPGHDGHVWARRLNGNDTQQTKTEQGLAPNAESA